MFDDGSEWARSLFSDSELSKFRRITAQAEEEQAELDAESELDEVQFASFQLYFQRETALQFLEWVRLQMNKMEHVGDTETAVYGWLGALGAAVSITYLTDAEWDYDEQLSDYASWFGAEDMFEFVDDDDEDDEDDKS